MCANDPKRTSASISCCGSEVAICPLSKQSFEPLRYRLLSLEVAMRRRKFLGVLSGGAVAWACSARAQQPAKTARIGFLGLAPASAWQEQIEAFRAGLRDFGYVEGRNITIDFEWAADIAETAELAARLVRSNVDIILAPASTQVEPARQATRTIPIVFAQHADPIGIGHVAKSCASRRKHHRRVHGPHRNVGEGTRNPG